MVAQQARASIMMFSSVRLAGYKRYSIRGEAWTRNDAEPTRNISKLRAKTSGHDSCMNERAYARLAALLQSQAISFA